MEFIDSLPIWILAVFIFFFRIIDVSLGTIRTIAVVQGWIRLSVMLGFFEVLLWLAAVSQVIMRVHTHPILMIAFAGGFASGNAVGIALERKIGLGSCVIRMISVQKKKEIEETIRGLGQRVTSFQGEGRDGPRTLLYITCERRDLKKIISTVKKIDPRLFYVVERVAESSHLFPLPHATGWRAVLKKK